LLRLFVHLNDHYLKVREAHRHEAFATSFTWKDELEVSYTEDPKFTMAWTSLLPDLFPTRARAMVELVGARYPFSTQFLELKEKCPELIFNHENPEWVFYAGSFNPWHHGHQACINLLPKDRACLVLPDINPHKAEREFELVSTVLEISTRARFGRSQYLVPSFLVSGTKNPTIDWIERFKIERPDKRASLLMGFDSFSNIHAWTRSSELLSLLDTLYVVSRMENDETRDRTVSRVQNLAPHLKIELLGRHGHEELSSTEIRRRL
jgi:nicotinic acid mononucleotide adenylyltransferase